MKFSIVEGFIYCEDDYFSTDNKEKLESMAKGLINVKEKFDLFVKTQGTLSDKEFINLYKKIFATNEIELYKAYFKQQFKKPVRKIIKVEGTAEHIEQEGHGRDFSWWTEYYKCSYEVVCSENTVFEDREYTQEEIKQLIEQGKICVINNNIKRGEQLYSRSKKLKSGQNIKTFSLTNEQRIKMIRSEMTQENVEKEYKKWLEKAGKIWGTVRAKIIKQAQDVINIVNKPQDLFK